jgi:hypothetical protein
LEADNPNCRNTATVAIHGDGVAALCCAHLLRNAGFRVATQRIDRPRVPAIMLSEAALELIRDVFERPLLFAGLPRIERRIVAWGDSPNASSLPHSAVVVSETLLLESLDQDGIAGNQAGQNENHPPEFTVYTSRPIPAVAREQRFGSRRASAAEVSLKDSTDLSACWIESLEQGWLFLIPNASESAAWLLAVGGPVEALLAKSHAIAPRLDLRGGRSGEFSTCPRILSPLCGDGWLACGTVAMGFDPICGDGTAHAIREAILASAVIRAIIAGGNAPSLYAHYETLLTAGMRRHLALCAGFYRTGGAGAWWQAELASIEEGYRWCTAELVAAGEPKYQLRGFELFVRDPVQGPARPAPI